jgi:hypothetical protein
MATFEMEIELTGLKFKIKGDKPEMQQQMAGELAKVISSVVEPVMRAASNPGEVPALTAASTPPAQVIAASPPRARRAKAQRAPAGEKADAGPQWRHDPVKWGPPLQAWKTPEKVIWLLRVAEAEVNRAELATGELAHSFNSMFKESGQIFTKNLPRDLKKSKRDALISQDPNTQKWYLTSNGKTLADKLISSAKSTLANGAQGQAN